MKNVKPQQPNLQLVRNSDPNLHLTPRAGRGVLRLVGVEDGHIRGEPEREVSSASRDFEKRFPLSDKRYTFEEVNGQDFPGTARPDWTSRKQD